MGYPNIQKQKNKHRTYTPSPNITANPTTPAIPLAPTSINWKHPVSNALFSSQRKKTSPVEAGFDIPSSTYLRPSFNSSIFFAPSILTPRLLPSSTIASCSTSVTSGTGHVGPHR